MGGFTRLGASIAIYSLRDFFGHLDPPAINLHHAYPQAGVDARLVVFDALPHALWYGSTLPEAIEANKMMANFFVQQLIR